MSSNREKWFTRVGGKEVPLVYSSCRRGKHKQCKNPSCKCECHQPEAPAPTPNAEFDREHWIYEDDLPADITKVAYDRWYSRSKIVDGVRMGPALADNAVPSVPDDCDGANLVPYTIPFAANVVPERRCVKCRHNNAVEGFCRKTLAELPSSGTWKDTHCGCKCVFAPTVADEWRDDARQIYAALENLLGDLYLMGLTEITLEDVYAQSAHEAMRVLKRNQKYRDENLRHQALAATRSPKEK